MTIYYYEIGLARFYNYSELYILIDFQTFFRRFKDIITLAILGIQLYYMYFLIRPNSNRFRFYLFNTFYSFFMIFLNVFSGKDKFVLYFFILWLLLIAISGYIFPLFKYRKEGTISTRYKLSESQFNKIVEDEDLSIRNPMERLFEFGGKFFVFAIIFPLYLSQVSNFAIGQCIRENVHSLTIIDNKEYIVVNRFDDSFLIAPIDLRTNKITPNYKLISVDKEVKITVEEIGTIEID